MFEKDRVLFILNTQDTTASIALPKPFINQEIYDLWYQRALTLGETLTLDAFDFMIIKR